MIPRFNYGDEPMDPAVIPLCDALNMCPSVYTTSSCQGHGGRFLIFFKVEDFATLARLTVWLTGCHAAQKGWRIEAVGHCEPRPGHFLLTSQHRGRRAYEGARKHARRIHYELKKMFTGKDAG